MDTKIIAFPTTRAAKAAKARPRPTAGSIISLERWKRRARLHRTANGVFFMTNVLTTTGDFA